MSDIKQQVLDLQNQLLELKESVEQLTDSGMRFKTVLILLSHYTGLPQKTIKQVLTGIENLNEEYFN